VARDVEEILDRDRDAVERPAVAAFRSSRAAWAADSRASSAKTS